jgi:hypothetical protein
MKKELQKEERLFERRAHTCDGGVIGIVLPDYFAMLYTRHYEKELVRRQEDDRRLWIYFAPV